MKDIYRDIERYYDALRSKNLRIKQQRKEEIYNEIPEIKKIDEMIVSLSVSASKEQILNPSKEKLTLINEDILRLRAEKEKILEEKGYESSYLDEIYNCNLCKDTGTLENGEKCGCFKKLLSEKLYSLSNIEYTLERENFNTFDLNIFSNEVDKEEGISPRENIEMIYKATLKFIKDFKSFEKNLLFYGPTGQGKTFMLNCIAKELMDREINVVYQTAFNLVNIIEDRKFRRDEMNSVKYDLLFQCDLLMIDDLGIESINSFTISEIFNLVNSRIISGKKTLISTNLTPKELSQTYTDRVFSRIMQKFVPIKFFGPDLRLN